MLPVFGNVDVYRKWIAAYPGEFCDKADRVNGGGRVLLPSSCLAELSTMNVAYPLQFRIRSRGRVCYAGVLEFNSENGVMIMPEWMFSSLLLEAGDTTELETCVLPPGRLVKLRPQQRSFIELSDPKQVLEQHLSEYPVLTRGTSIALRYLDREFVIDVTDITDEADRSVEAISTVRSDAQATELKVEFERPLDMPPSPTEDEERPLAGASNVIGSPDGLEFVTPLAMKPPSLVGERPKPVEEVKQTAFVPFTGGGRRINDKPAPPSNATQNEKKLDEKAREKRFEAFAGTGRSLR